MSASDTGSRKGLLDLVEWIGNKLPDPTTLFLLGTILVMVLSHIGATAGWRVEKFLPQTEMVTIVDPETGEEVEQAKLDEDGKPIVAWVSTGEIFEANSLLTREGFYYAVKSMVDNFMDFAPLGVVLVGMLGIGIAERTGLIGSLLKACMLVVPNGLLTPAMVFVGIMSSMTLDAGYVVLPPLAMALYKAVGRSPLAGLAAVFAGVSAGFNANLLITGLDPMLANLSTIGAQVVDPAYRVGAPSNWFFMIASTFVMTATGWGVTAWFVERRLKTKSAEEGGPVPASEADLAEQKLAAEEKKSLKIGTFGFIGALAVFLVLIMTPGLPLYTFKVEHPVTGEKTIVEPVSIEGRDDLSGVIAKSSTGETSFADASMGEGYAFYEITGEIFERWVEIIVPMLFFCFITGAIAYGIAIGNLKNDKDVAKMLIQSMASMAPIIVLAFFAAQFISYFGYSQLDKMLALKGGQMLGQAEMSAFMLVVAFILVTMLFNLFIGSMSAKYTLFAPIFIPMFMLVGISPELTQAAYRVGDSTTNIITPLNAYLVIILVFMQKYVPKGGMGTLIATMLPYTIVFTLVWGVMLLIWMGFDFPLGPGGPLTYDVMGAAAANGGG